jgi:hypothetical protein
MISGIFREQLVHWKLSHKTSEYVLEKLCPNLQQQNLIGVF